MAKDTPSTESASSGTPMSRRELESKIVAKAWRDPKYRAALLKDPKSILESELKAVHPDIELPDKLTVNVHEEDADTYQIVLPRNPKDISLAEVIGDNLEAVAPQTVVIVTVLGTNSVVLQVNSVISGSVVTGITPVLVSSPPTVVAANVVAAAVATIAGTS